MPILDRTNKSAVEKYNELTEKLTTEEVFNNYNLLKQYSKEK